MNVGIVCYASVGGSGIVATELAKVLARRGHEVRLISSEQPFRLVDFQAGLAFHAVQTPGYPLFREPQYLLSLTNKIVEVSREFDLDIIHAHYAVPHATAAYLARQILAASGRAGDRTPVHAYSHVHVNLQNIKQQDNSPTTTKGAISVNFFFRSQTCIPMRISKLI